MEIKNTDQIMRADIMLARIQDKNELANAGDIYVGTGDTPDVVDASAGEDGKVAKPTVKNIQTVIREDANNQNGLRLGGSTSSSYSNVVELGIEAKVEANNACQIGGGTNTDKDSLKFRNRVVVNSDGEISGDYPLGFTKKKTEWPGDTWPISHTDLGDGVIVTDWAYTTSQGYNSEIAFVSVENQAADSADLNLVIDGNIYVREGKKKVYAEGDVVEKAKTVENVDGFTSIELKTPDQLVQDVGKIVTKSCTFYTNNAVVLEKGYVNIEQVSIPAGAQGLIATDGEKKLSIIYTVANTNFNNYGSIKHCFYNYDDATWKKSLISFIDKPIYSAHNGDILLPIKREGPIYYSESVEGGVYYFSCNNNKVNFGLVYYDGEHDVSAVAPLYTRSNGNLVLTAEYLLYIYNDDYSKLPYIYLYKKESEGSGYTVANSTAINYRKM